MWLECRNWGEERTQNQRSIRVGGMVGRGAVQGPQGIVKTWAMNEMAWKRLAIYQTVSSSSCEYSRTTFPNRPWSVAMRLSSGQRKRGGNDICYFQHWPYKSATCDSSGSFLFCGHRSTDGRVRRWKEPRFLLRTTHWTKMPFSDFVSDKWTSVGYFMPLIYWGLSVTELALP